VSKFKMQDCKRAVSRHVAALDISCCRWSGDRRLWYTTYILHE